MNLTQQILAAHTDEAALVPGQLIYARVDLAMGNDVTAPVAIREFRRCGRPRVWDAQKIALVLDHFTPNKDLQAAALSAEVRAFAAEQGISHFYDVGEMGIEHALLPEQGLVRTGDLVIGADSHTCTYGALGAFSTGVGSTDLGCAFATGDVYKRQGQPLS